MYKRVYANNKDHPLHDTRNNDKNGNDLGS